MRTQRLAPPAGESLEARFWPSSEKKACFGVCCAPAMLRFRRRARLAAETQRQAGLWSAGHQARAHSCILCRPREHWPPVCTGQKMWGGLASAALRRAPLRVGRSHSDAFFEAPPRGGTRRSPQLEPATSLVTRSRPQSPCGGAGPEPGRSGLGFDVAEPRARLRPQTPANMQQNRPRAPAAPAKKCTARRLTSKVAFPRDRAGLHVAERAAPAGRRAEFPSGGVRTGPLATRWAARAPVDEQSRLVDAVGPAKTL